ncbi:helicase associated domain-containing protein, partial [Streptomyces broussonetiae]
GHDKLTTVQQWMLEHILGIQPADEDEKPRARRSQGDRWTMNYTAARQFYQREGHLLVPRKHIETIAVARGDGRWEEQEVKLGTWISNQRSRAATLAPERVQRLSAIGMRWT